VQHLPLSVMAVVDFAENVRSSSSGARIVCKSVVLGETACGGDRWRGTFEPGANWRLRRDIEFQGVGIKFPSVEEE
jgi:hypothetical protein